MLIMLIKFDGILNGSEALLPSDLVTDPAGQMLGENTYAKTGLLGRIDPVLAFAGDERHEGYRLDLVHVQQQAVPATGSVSVTDGAGAVLFADVLDLSTGANVSASQKDIFVPPGYVVELVGDAPSGGNIIALGLTPLVSPVDWWRKRGGGDGPELMVQEVPPS